MTKGQAQAVAARSGGCVASDKNGYYVVKTRASRILTREGVARRMAATVRLPVVVDQATKELYGRAVPVLDEAAADLVLAKAGIPEGCLREAALEVLRDRVDALATRS